MSADRTPSSSAKKTWKDHLLRSGLPLEHEVARILAKERMSVTADFSFVRRDGLITKEWSVDLEATWYGETKNNGLKYEVLFLIECKYRSDDKVMLFVEDPNLDTSPITLGGTINSFDHFTPFHVTSIPFSELESEFRFVYKGTELHSGGAVDEDLRHAIQQLRYATPAFLRENIDFNISNHAEDILPIFFTKILVTNSPIKLLKSDISINEIRSANSIDDISSVENTVILFSDYGAEYENHVKSTFEYDPQDRMEISEYIKESLQRNGKEVDSASDPYKLLKNIMSGRRYECRSFATQFFITNIGNLPNLISRIKKSCELAYKGRRKKRRSKMASSI